MKLRREQREKGSDGVIPYDGKVERELKKKRGGEKAPQKEKPSTESDLMMSSAKLLIRY